MKENCSNHECAIQDYCWTYCKPPELDKETGRPVEIKYQPEVDNIIEFKCKHFTNYPE